MISITHLFYFQEALGSLSSSSNGGDKSFAKESKKAEKMASSPPPKPQLPVQPAATSAIEANKEAANTTLDDSAKKPDWLAELSRKQANRRSGLFSGNSSETALNVEDTATAGPTAGTGSKPLTSGRSSLTSGGSSPPKMAENNNIKPVIAPDKPHIPLKPSQIRDEGESQLFVYFSI